MMLPKTTWPTSPGSTPARLTASRTHRAARSLGGKSFKLPPNPPIAVRAPLRTTTSRVLLIANPPLNEIVGAKHPGAAVHCKPHTKRIAILHRSLAPSESARSLSVDHLEIPTE